MEKSRNSLINQLEIQNDEKKDEIIKVLSGLDGFIRHSSPRGKIMADLSETTKVIIIYPERGEIQGAEIDGDLSHVMVNPYSGVLLSCRNQDERGIIIYRKRPADTYSSP